MDRTQRIAELYRKLLEEVGEDLGRSGLHNTPERASEAIQFLTEGYRENLDSLVNDAVFACNSDDMVIVKDIEVYSLCEHHMLPFIGKCHVAYIPNGKVLGVSKVSRVIDAFARRLQLQENLTREIAETVMHYTGAQGVGVVIEAQHLCMMMRGVEKQNSLMKTSCMLGIFRNDSATRAEFLNLIT